MTEEKEPVREETAEEKAERELKNQLSLMNLYSFDHTFKAFNQRRKGVKEAYDAFKTLAEGETDKPFLLCSGGEGNGKTHLCEAFVLRKRDMGILTRYNTVTEVLSMFRQAVRQDTNMPPVDILLKNYAEARYLILDDYGAQYETSWEMGIIDALIDTRYRAKRVTILTTKDISEVPERMSSRFSDPEVGVIVVNEGSNYRKRNIK